VANQSWGAPKCGIGPWGMGGATEGRARGPEFPRQYFPIGAKEMK
jgi:hypothetical protein